MPDWHTENLSESRILWTGAIAGLLDDFELYSTLKQHCLEKISEYRERKGDQPVVSLDQIGLYPISERVTWMGFPNWGFLAH